VDVASDNPEMGAKWEIRVYFWEIRGKNQLRDEVVHEKILLKSILNTQYIVDASELE
jgi:hypothetical protein